MCDLARCLGMGGGRIIVQKHYDRIDGAASQDGV